jgi:uroporphyrinogen decarboxylase
MSQIIPSSPEEVREMLVKLYGDPTADAMSSYERVEAAVNLKAPDRVPFDFWGVPETVEKLKKYLNAENDEEMLKLLGIDCRLVSPDYIGPEPEKLEDGTFYSVWGSHRRLVHNEFSTYEEYASFPLENATSKAEVESWEKWPKSSYWNWDSIAPKIEKLNENVRYHIRYEVGGIFESSWALYGLDKFLMDLMTNPEVPCAIMDCYTDLMIENVKKLGDAAGDKIDMVYTYDDVAIQNSLLMSPRMWRKHILPRHQRLNKVIKDYGIKIMYHSCGAVTKLIDPFIDEMGIDVLNPLQPRAKGMDMAWIKETFGKRVAFHGGIDLQQTLPLGSQQEVYDEVRDRCEVLGKDGGYICTSAHYIQADVPVENIITLYSTPRNA